jgi:hypothetical protein
MAKTIVKELIIILLLCLAIILVLGVLLYEYVPMTKTVPNPVSYTTPTEVQEELANTTNEVIETFETTSDSLGVDSSDLNNYTKIQDYKPGKANPFSSYASTTSEENTTSGSSTSGTTSSNSSASSSNSSQSSSSNETTTSGGTFFNDKGTK